MPPKTKTPKKPTVRKPRSDCKAASENAVRISAYEICKEIKEGSIKPEDLTDIQLDACIEYMKFELGHTNMEIADFLKRHRHTIAAHCRTIEEKQAQELANKGIDKYKIAFKLYTVTEMIMANARRKGDWRLMMDAYHKMIEKYQSLGVLYEAPKKHELSGEIEHRHKVLMAHVYEAVTTIPEEDRKKIVRTFTERQRRAN